jgi:RimJ/RimL family protein N-acetyltransferase
VTPEPHVVVTRQRVRIHQLDVAALTALAVGDLSGARRTAGVSLGSDFDQPDWRSTWAMRAAQIQQDPASAAWVTGVIVDLSTGAAVGRAGFHGPPDAAGMVEVGYAVLPQLRRRGFGQATLAALLNRVAGDPAVRTVRASISPDNLASQRLVEPFGFVAVGEQWDDEDGLEIVYEVPNR